MNPRRTCLILALAGLTAAFAWYVSRRPMDFRVYHYGARGVLDGTRPVYGNSSGLGWPMHYRYPPLFLLLFFPFAWIPLPAGAALWLVLKAIVLFLLVQAAYRRRPFRWWIPLLLAGPYVVEDFRYGNVQFFIFALTAAAILLVRERPQLAAGFLALGISVKVWPLFFVPYLLARGERKVVAGALAITLVLTLLPGMYFGFDRNLSLLGEWFHQEFATQAGQDEIWFPSQSLRGVMMRYLTDIDYSTVPDSNYRQVAVTHWNPAIVRTAWLGLAGVIYAAFVLMVYRKRAGAGWLESGLAFCLLALLQPFTQKYALVVLLWPALMLGQFEKRTAIRNVILVSGVLILMQPLIPGAASQRLMQVLGVDFVATMLITLALMLSLTSGTTSVTSYSSLRNIYLKSE